MHLEGNITKEEVLRRLCALCTKVGGDYFNHELPHDCFCGDSPHGNFQFNEQIIFFMEDMINGQLKEK